MAANWDEFVASQGGAKPAAQQPSAPASWDDFVTQQGKDSGDFMRGTKVALGQTGPLLKGAVGLLGATAEKAVGEGGMATAVKNWGLSGFDEGMKKLQPLQHENDDVTVAWQRAKEGDLGALVDWAQYALGYGMAQVAETAAIGVAGGLLGSAAGGVGAAPGAVAGVVAKETTKGLIRAAIEKEIARRAGANASEAAIQAATKSLAKDVGTVGSLTGYNVAVEAGSIYPEAVDQAKKEGRELSGSDLARVWGAAAIAGGSETIPDMIGLGAVSGRLKGLIPGESRLTRAATGAAGGAAIEAGQETFQTAAERYGAGKPLTGDEATRDYINSAAMAALPGGVVGGTAGLLHSKPAPDAPELTLQPDAALAGPPEPLKALPAPVVQGQAGTSLEAQNATQGTVEAAQASADAVYAARDAEEQRARQAFMDLGIARTPDEMIDAALRATEPLFLTDVHRSVAGGLLNSQEQLTPASPREADLVHARAQVDEAKQADYDKIQAANRESGLPPITPEDLQPVAPAPTPEDRRGAIADAMGKLILQRMETLKAREQGQQPGASQPAPGTPTDVKLFGKPLNELTHAELALAARSHRMSGFREAARAEIARRSGAAPVASEVRAAGQAPDVGTGTSPTVEAQKPGPVAAAIPAAAVDVTPAQPAAQVPEVPGTGETNPAASPAPAARTPASVAPAAPLKILGKTVDQLTKRALQVAAKSGRTPEIRTAATAELERRQAQPAPAIAPAQKTSPLAIEPVPVEDTSGNPTRPPNARWHSDRGSMPGEPMMLLDAKEGDPETAKAAIIEREIPGKGVLYDARDSNGNLLGTGQTVQEAAAIAEKAFPEAAGTPAPEAKPSPAERKRQRLAEERARREEAARQEEVRRAERDRIVAEQAAELDKNPPKFARDEKRGAGLTRDVFRSALAKAFGEKAAARLLDSGTLVVLDTQDKLPAHVVPYLRAGDKTYGFHDPRTDRTYAVLENLSEADVRGLVLHEVGIHYGFQKMLGDAKYAQVMRRLEIMRKAGNKNVQAAHEKAIAEAAEDSQVAEETLAYLVYNHPEMSLVQEVIAAIRAFLYREFGIGAGGLTEADMTMLAKAAVMKAGLQEETTPQLAPAFAKEGGEKPPAPEFKTAIRELIKGQRDKRETLFVSEASPAVMQTLGMPDLKVAIPGHIPEKMIFDHALSEQMVARLPELLANPVMVFESETHPGDYVFVTTEFVQKMPLVISVRPNGNIGREQAHIVTSGYPRAKAGEAFARWLKGGLLRYVDTAKRPVWQRSAGLQLPGEMLTRGAGRSLRTQDDLVKPPAGGGGTTEGPQSKAPSFARAAWVERESPATQEALRKAGVWYAPPTLTERIKAWRADWGKRVRQGLVDQFDAIKQYDYKAYMLSRMTRSADAALEAVLHYGTVKLDSEGAIDVNFEKGGFLKILRDLKGEHERFFAWIVGNRAERLKAEDREHNFTDADITALKALSQGQMKDGRSRAQAFDVAKAALDRYNKSVLDVAEKAGLIDGGARSSWEKDFYVPFYRLMEGEDQQKPMPAMTRGLVNQYAFKVLKGGEQALGDPLENVLKNWSHLIDASLKNQAAKASLLAAERVGAVVEADEATARSMAKSISNKRGAVSFLDQGKQRWFVVEDAFLLDALRSIGYTGFSGPAMKVMSQFKRWLTMGVTVSPTFRIRNVIRDSLQMIGTNPANYNVLDNLVTGWKATKEDTPEFASLLAGGGVMRFGSALEGDRAANVKRLIEAGVPPDSIINTPAKAKQMLKNAWDWWQKVGDRAENINRAALYKKLRSEGKTHLEASFAARDSMDFSMQGTWAAVRFLTQTVPFMNARVQGLYKLGRGAAEDPRRFGIVVGGATIASLALFLAYKDDEDWKAREDWDRESFWWFKIGGKSFRIPKPFEIGAIATLAERALEWMSTDELTGKQFADRVYNVVSQQLSLNPVPQLLTPLIEVYANRNSFTNRPIESMGMEKLSPSQRSGPGTSATAQLLGKNNVVSPVQIDHLIRGYFGWLGAHIVSTSDLALRPAMDLPGQPAWKIDDVLVAGDFVKDLPAHQSKYVTRLYDQMKEVQQAMADLRHLQQIGATEKAREHLEANRDKIQLYRLYTHAEKQLSDVNRQIKLTQSRDGDAEMKRERLDALYETRNRIARLTEERTRERAAQAR
jgi:hypothetical protein